MRQATLAAAADTTAGAGAAAMDAAAADTAGTTGTTKAENRKKTGIEDFLPMPVFSIGSKSKSLMQDE